MIKDLEMIQEIGKYEDSHNVSDADRVTSWYGDYTMYEQKFGIADEKIMERYKEMQGEVLEEEWSTKREPAKDPFLKGYVWEHYDDRSGRLCDEKGERIAGYNLDLRELEVKGKYFNFSGETEFGLRIVMEKAEEQVKCNLMQELADEMALEAEADAVMMEQMEL